MMDQVNIHDFFTKCGPTSTPIVKKQRISRSRECNRTNNANDDSCKDTIPRLLESKEVWPIAFGKTCQDFLNELKLGLDSEFLLLDPTKDKLKRLSPMISRHSRSRTRDRSMSPSGARKMSENKWDQKMETVLLLIDHTMVNIEKLPEQFLLHSKSKSDAKELLDMLSKNVSSQQKLKKLHEINLFVAGQALRMMLEKMGVLLPEMISNQMLSLKTLICKNGNNIVKLKQRIEAVQTMMLNISKKSRQLIQRILILFQILSKAPHVGMNSSTLAALLRPCLFEGGDNLNSIKLCSDFIVLSNRIFDAPPELLQHLKERINTRPDTYNPFEQKVEKPIKFYMKNLPANRCSPAAKIQNFFTHTKSITQIEPVVLTSVRKIMSPEKDQNIRFNKPLMKRKSFIEMTKRICDRSFSPFRATREYKMTDYFPAKKQKL